MAGDFTNLVVYRIFYFLKKDSNVSDTDRISETFKGLDHQCKQILGTGPLSQDWNSHSGIT